MAVQVMEVGQLSKVIKVIGRQKVRLDSMVQTAVVQCVAQSIVHRNSTPAAALFEALGPSSRRDALVKFCEMFGNLAWSKGEKRIVFYDVAKVENKPELAWTDEYSQKVSEFVWHKAKPEAKQVSMYDVEEKVSTLIDSLRKSAKKGITLENVALLDAVERVYVKYVAEAFDPLALAPLKADGAVIDAGEAAQAVADAKAKAAADAAAQAVADAPVQVEPQVQAA